MFFVTRGLTRGRRGKSLIWVGVLLIAIGAAVSVISYAFAASHGSGHVYFSITPIVVGVVSVFRGISQAGQDRKAAAAAAFVPGAAPGYGTPGQQPGYGTWDAGAQGTGPRDYDQPGYAMPRENASASQPASAAPSAAIPQAGLTPPNWYPDPANQAMVRWWDGQAWTRHTQPRA